MKAIIFAAGLGTRLRPLTNDRPKALVEVAGKPMLQRVIEHVRDEGFDDITVNVHHFADKVIDFLHRIPLGVNIHISDERDQLLETGGGILKAQSWLDGEEPFLVHNADILTDLNLRAMFRQHVESDALATILVKDRVTQRYFVFDDDYRLQGWTNIATGETRPSTLDVEGLKKHAFGGIHVVSPQIFRLLSDYADREGEKFSTTPFYIHICQQQKVLGYMPQDDYHWFDVGKPETLIQAEEFVKSREAATL